MQDQSLRSVVSSFFFQMILFLQGASHAGKTTFAKRLARLTGASVVSLDLLKMGLIKSGNSDFAGLTPEDDEAIAERLWPIVREMARVADENMSQPEARSACSSAAPLTHLAAPWQPMPARMSAQKN